MDGEEPLARRDVVADSAQQVDAGAFVEGGAGAARDAGDAPAVDLADPPGAGGAHGVGQGSGLRHDVAASLGGNDPAQSGARRARGQQLGRPCASRYR